VAPGHDGQCESALDLNIIGVPTLVMHGDDDQIVPIADSALFPHGMCTTHADVINADLLAFIKS
jgi:non-heme chloroperoxidase